MDKVLAQGAARPAAAEKCFVAIEFFLTDLAVPSFNSQQHRLPVPASVSNTHATEYIEGAWREARGAKHPDPEIARCRCSLGGCRFEGAPFLLAREVLSF